MLIPGAAVTVTVTGPVTGYNYVHFVPPYIAAGPGDSIVFAVSSSVAAQTIVAAANTTTAGRCVPRAAGVQPNITVTVASGASSDPIALLASDGFVSPGLNNPPLVVPLMGNAADCNAGLRGSILFGSFTRNCAAQTTRDACSTEGSRTGVGNGACVWCGTSPTSGTCFVPPWYGAYSCPCTQDSCFPDYLCPSGSTEVSRASSSSSSSLFLPFPHLSLQAFCGSSCFTPNATVCPSYRLSAASLSTLSLALLALALLALAF